MQHALLDAPLSLAIRGRGWRIIIDSAKSAKRRRQNWWPQRCGMEYEVPKQCLKEILILLSSSWCLQEKCGGCHAAHTHFLKKNVRCDPIDGWRHCLDGGWRELCTLCWLIGNGMLFVCLTQHYIVAIFPSRRLHKLFFPVCCCEFKHQRCSTHCCKGCINYHHYQIRSPHSTCERAKNLSRKKAARKYYIFW